jgi:hypothetical protein
MFALDFDLLMDLLVPARLEDDFSVSRIYRLFDLEWCLVVEDGLLLL